MQLTRRQACLAALASLAPASAWADQSLPFALTHGRIAVSGRIDGNGPFLMFVDTGATAGVISAVLVSQLSLPVVGHMTTQFGDSFAYTQVNLTLGDTITLIGTPMSVLDTPVFLGDPLFQALVPASVLTALDSAIDFDALTITRYPDAAPDRSGYVPLSSSFGPADAHTAARPFSDVTIGPNTVHALWDTGSPTSMELSRAAGDRLRLWNDSKPYAPDRYGHVGGDDSGVSRVIRAGPISVGPVTYDSSLILLRADGQDDSVFGLALITTLNIIVDASARTLWVVRNNRPQSEIGYNISGVSLTQGSGQLVVADVGTGSPAAAAGLRRGDLVLIPATMDAVYKLLDAPVGTGVGLTIQREAGPVLITFTLTPYL
jgi:serine protease Do